MAAFINLNLPLPGTSPIHPVLTAFPANPQHGAGVIRSDLGNELFRYNSVSNEWVGTEMISYTFGSADTIAGGLGLRYCGAARSAAGHGAELGFRTRFYRATGGCSSSETGTYQVRLRGVTAFNLPITNNLPFTQNTWFNYPLAENDPNVLLDILPNVKNSITVFWIAGAGDIDNPTLDLFGHRIVLPGE